MGHPTFRRLTAAAWLGLATSQIAQAQFNFTLVTPNVTASAGHTVTFQALLTNDTGAPLFLNGDLGLIDPPLTLDDLPFQTTFLLSDPLMPLEPDGLPHAFDLFTVELPADPSAYVGFPSTFNGSFTLYGGALDTDQDELGSQDFSITVDAVPEPSSLIALGFLSLGCIRRARGGRR